MTVQIRANRLEVTDRFPMLGFTIRTDGTPQRAEVAIATDTKLFSAANKAQRTLMNFYSSRAGGPLSVPRGEAVYVVPSEVLARFVGNDRLYVALAAMADRTGAVPVVEVIPTEGSPYVSLKGLTGRSLKRVRLLPNRQQRAAGYGANSQSALEWAGDAAQPGQQPVPVVSTAPSQPSSPPPSGSNDHDYDDGFGPLPPAPPIVSTSSSVTPNVQAQSYHQTPTYSMASQSFTLNWDEVEAIPQPTDVSCWAAAAAMVVGWKERVSLSPESLAGICSRTTATGLDPAQVERFAGEIGLSFEYPQCYTVEGFRNLVETRGPLWVGASVPGLHAIVVTGIYSDGTKTYVRITDPWDRQVGTPGAPGSYLDSHVTGSRYILRWEDFVREYESAATDFSGVNLQILHAGDTGGRMPNYGSPSPPPGYAQGLLARTTGYPLDNKQPTRLPSPPQSRAFNNPVATPLPPIRRRLSGGNTSVYWELDQYDGMKQQTGSRITNASVPTKGQSINISDWPYIEGVSGRTYASVLVDWKHDNGMVGDVQISVPQSMVNDNYIIKVTADIGDGPDTPNVATLRITLRYEFSHPGETTHVAVTEVTLYGDGRHERQNRWDASAQARAA